ncbi:hypothetical protein WJX72_012184 [[Myrmecia] bisecta]|uniref:Signal peptide peptidase n=1 Tax=[Myrmecia] bisecta TaxID=41462 RepID=A0AAW1P8G2_9CHLO
MSNKDAMRFPMIGSAVLLSLFLLFKFLPKDLVNAVLTAYFVLLGTFAITATLLPFLEAPFSLAVQQRSYGVKGIRIPIFLKEPTDVLATVPELIGGACSLVFCCWYYAQKHWLANNVLGLAFSVQGIEHLSLGSIQTGIILLSGLFFYDIFWVFCTPVMVTVAKSFDAPIKLLFPRVVDEAFGKVPFSMLGLGDVVIPGIFVALVLRYDAKNNFRTNYFRSAFLGYTAGLATTIIVMNVFNAAQPALLYIVPAVLGAVFLHAVVGKDVSSLFAFNESPPKDEESVDENLKASQPAVDREKTCPLLLRVFTKLGGHHRLEDYQHRGQEPADETQIYTWMDASLSELTDLVKEVMPAARRPNARLDFAFVYPDRKGRNVMRQVGSTNSTRVGGDDAKTLRSLNFQTGDYLDVAIY